MFNEEQLEDATLSILENLGYERLNGYDIDRDYHSVFMDVTLFDDLSRINKDFNDNQITEAIKTIRLYRMVILLKIIRILQNIY